MEIIALLLALIVLFVALCAIVASSSQTTTERYREVLVNFKLCCRHRLI